MNKVLTYILIMFSSIILAQEKIDYPTIYTDSLGQRVITMTIEQAQILDNDTDLLIEFKKLADADEIEKIAYINVINSNNIIIASQKIEISKLNLTIDGKSNEIAELKNRLNEYSINNSILNEKFNKSQLIVNEKNKQLTNLKTKMIIGGIGGAIAIVALIAIILIP